MEEQKKIISKSNIGKFIIFMIVIIFIAIILVRYLINDEFRDRVDTEILNKQISENESGIIEINKDGNPNIYAFDKYIAVLMKGILTFYNQDSNIESKFDVDIKTPYVETNGKFFALAEEGGSKIYLLTATEKKWENDIDGNIYRINVNENGYVSVILKNSTYNSIIIVFDVNGKELFKTYLAKNYAICSEISNNNKYLAIGQIDYTGTIVKSVVKIISMDLAEKDPQNSILNTYESESNRILNNLTFNKKNEAICMFDTYVQKVTIKSDEKMYEIINDDIFVDVNLGNNIVVIEKENSGLFSYKYQMNLKNTEGKSDNLYILGNDVPKSLRVGKNLICLGLVGEVRIVNSSGWLVKKYITNSEIQDIVVGDNIVGVIYNNKIEIINI